jgi:WhiB family redox-sensing transcriptional regulator
MTRRMLAQLNLSEEPLCAETDPELFFPPKGGSGVSTRAYDICHTCPVEAECLDFALRYRLDGIWGGTSEIQRRRIRRALGITAEPVSDDEAEAS